MYKGIGKDISVLTSKYFYILLTLFVSFVTIEEASESKPLDFYDHSFH